MEKQDKYLLERAREISRATSEPVERIVNILKAPIEAPHYQVHGWIVREDPGTIMAEFGLATGISVNPDLPNTLKKICVAHEIGHGESIGKKLQKGEPVSFGREFECLAWQEGISAARELGVLDEYLEYWQKDTKYLKCAPLPREKLNG